MTRDEAKQAIDECHKLRASIDRLLIKAMKALRPQFEVIHGGKPKGCTSNEKTS